MYEMIMNAHETIMNVNSCEIHRYEYLCMLMLINTVYESFENME